LRRPKNPITCNAICPGYVYTPLVEAQIEGQAKTHNVSRDRVISEVLLATSGSQGWKKSPRSRSFWQAQRLLPSPGRR
jgi:hypothetical protein